MLNPSPANPNTLNPNSYGSFSRRRACYSGPPICASEQRRFVNKHYSLRLFGAADGAAARARPKIVMARLFLSPHLRSLVSVFLACGVCSVAAGPAHGHELVNGQGGKS